MVSEGAPVFPTSNLHNHAREHPGFEQADAPTPPEVVRADVLPAVVARLGATPIAGAGDPVVDRRRVTRDERLVGVTIEPVGEMFELARREHLAVLVALPVPDADDRPGVVLDEVGWPHAVALRVAAVAGDLLAAEPAARGEHE